MEFDAGTSRIDGREAMILDYAPYENPRAAGMRDEIRRVNERPYLWMGYMSPGGGSINPAPFLLLGPGTPGIHFQSYSKWHPN